MDKIEKEKEVSLLDFVIIFIKNKKFLIGTTFICMVIFYLLIFFFVDEQFDSTATIVPSQESSISGLAGMLGGLGDLPFGIGGASANPEVGLYNTILQSRTTIESVINKFNLWKVFKLDRTDPKQVKKIHKAVRKSISTEETDDGAYVLTVRSSDAQLSADIVNFLVTYLNKKIIDLKVDKSRNNRLFLEERLADIRRRLKMSEDSLKNYQEETNVFSPESQMQGILTTYTKLEQELLTKQMQKEILEHIYGKDSPELRKISFEVNLFKDQFNKLKMNGKSNSIFIPFKTIPDKVMRYYRYFREVETNQAILKFILPLYEQAKIEEQKKTPILQVIDNAIPEKVKSFPPRTILTLLVGFGSFVLLFTMILFKENNKIQNSEKMRYVRKNLFKWRVEN